MAKGRMINREIGSNERFCHMSKDAQLFYFFVLAYLDRDGLVKGHPAILSGMATPLHSDLRDKAAGLIGEWLAHGFAIRYEWTDGIVLFFPDFRKDNQSLKYEREQPSIFPPPPGFHRSPLGLIPDDGELAGRQAEKYDPRSKYHEALTEADSKDGDGLEDILSESGPPPDNIRTRSGSHPEEVRTNGIEVEVKDQVKEEEKNERMNEYAPQTPDSFIHSLPDAQIDFDNCFELLTDPEVGLDEKGARDLAAKVSFDLLERHVFAWLAERKNGGSFSMTGALIHRIKSKFSAPALTAEQKRSALYGRFHTAGYSGYLVGVGDRFADWSEAEVQAEIARRDAEAKQAREAQP